MSHYVRYHVQRNSQTDICTTHCQVRKKMVLHPTSPRTVTNTCLPVPQAAALLLWNTAQTCWEESRCCWYWGLIWKIQQFQQMDKHSYVFLVHFHYLLTVSDDYSLHCCSRSIQPTSWQVTDGQHKHNTGSKCLHGCWYICTISCKQTNKWKYHTTE